MTNSELNELKTVVRRAIEEEREMYDEHWVTADQLIAQFGMFTKSWLKTYGHSLPRKRATVCDERGERHSTSWCYPRNKIQRMIQSGEIEQLRCRVVLNVAI